MPLTSGQILNTRYRIVKLLGQGGFGAVYRAWDLNLSRPCAIKENLETTLEAQQQFQREAQMLSNLHHPNLPRVIDYFFISGQGQYLVMDFVEGDDLQSILDNAGNPLLESQVLPWIHQVCDALSYLHRQNPPIIHRDVKPRNIIITPSGQAMLVDFGIAKLYDPQLKTTIGARAVTPGYSPNEQYGLGITDAASDIYALGATLYTLLTNQVPVESVQRTAMPLPAPRSINLFITPGIERAILKAMELSPAQRFQSMRDFRASLEQPSTIQTSPPPVIASLDAQYPPATIAPSPGAQAAGRKISPLAVTAVVVICILASTSAWIGNRLLSGASLALEATPTSRPTSTRNVPATEPAEASSSTPFFPSPTLPSTLPSIQPPTPLPITVVPPSTLQPVTPTPLPDRPPSKKSAPSTVAFSIVSQAKNAGQSIVLISPDGTNRRLLPNQPRDSKVPNFTRDGSQLVFVSKASGSDQLYTIMVDGSHLKQLTSGAANYDACWSPDGKQLAFVSERDGNPEIYLMNADGKHLKRLTSYEGVDGDPTWSADGKQIAFERQTGDRWGIFLINTNGSNLWEVMGEGQVNSTPAWSPDGSRIAFERKVDDQWGIWVMNADGSRLRPLFITGSINYRPAWSADASQIAWSSDAGGIQEIWVMNADGSEAHQVTSENGAYDPGWGGGN
jgi:Tol biopolymer transport system component/predicted Ser/Thr protein kinase